VMWIPLVILAAASIFGGWINVPAPIAEAPVFGWLPHSEWLHHWLEPITAPADAVLAANVPEKLYISPLGGGEAIWAAFSFLGAMLIIVIGTWALRRRVYVPAGESPVPRGVEKVLVNKWYVDEFYDAAIVRPIVRSSRGLWRWIDAGLVDGAVNGAGYASRAFGWVGSRMQTGQLNTYAFAIVLGALLVLGLVAF
jgi:NADH-quinone oxidoreductase subunit L